MHTCCSWFSLNPIVLANNLYHLTSSLRSQYSAVKRIENKLPSNDLWKSAKDIISDWSIIELEFLLLISILENSARLWLKKSPCWIN